MVELSLLMVELIVIMVELTSCMVELMLFMDEFHYETRKLLLARGHYKRFSPLNAVSSLKS
ncbi:hypothetical protein [Peribacillus sp. NPDC097225]|uniref:hypothetical protein n=1 Tax=Peribacillus sp. NPDC097225 TaxID=3364400 RepID=UPI00380A2ABF